MTRPTSPVFDKQYAGFLFDLDGTLLNSIAAAERVWSRWALAKGLDLKTFLPSMHGRRGIDTIRSLGLPDVDAEIEAKHIERGEIEDVEGVVPLPGAIEFLHGLPEDRWAIVTSCPIALAKARLAAAGLPMPAVLVTAEDVENGKPDPAGYLLGASRLGLDPTLCLVFEDVEAGATAAVRAGADVVMITETHDHGLSTNHAKLRNYLKLEVRTDQRGLMRLSVPFDR